jgi:hypothetical protein
MELVNTLNVIKNQDSSYNEESSFYLLKDLQLHKKWFIYSSKSYPIALIQNMANLFCYSHGMALVDPKADINDPKNYFWSSIPLGILRYKMLEDGSFAEVNMFDKRPGYIVESAYWVNGFVYQVRNNDFVLEVNLFIDEETKKRYNYQDPENQPL